MGLISTSCCVISEGGCGPSGLHPPPRPSDDDSVTSEKWAVPLSSVSKVTMALELEETVKSKMSSLDTDMSVLRLDTLHTETSSLRFKSPPAALRPPPDALEPGLYRREDGWPQRGKVEKRWAESQGSSSKGKVAGEPARRGRAPPGGLISRVASPESREDELWLSWSRPQQVGLKTGRGF